MEIATAELEKSQQKGDIEGSSRAFLLLGELHFNNGNYERAATYFGYAVDGFQALKMQNESLKAENLQSDALAKAGNTKDALLKKKKVAVSSNFKPKEKAELVNQIAVLESKSGNNDKARELLKENIRNNADTVTQLNAINQLSNLYIQSGQTDSAVALVLSNQWLIIQRQGG
jgi:tetratricopeptide (TPR) repeat protein